MRLAVPEFWACCSRLSQACVLGLVFLAGGEATLADEYLRTSQREPAAPDLALLDAYIDEEMRAERIPGLAVAIVRGTELVYSRGFGMDGAGGAITPQTSFVIGSMSKSVTALAVMQLVDRRLVELDAPVQRYLPDFKVADPIASSRITVRHLLNHTSGLSEKAPRGTGNDATLQTHVAALARTELASTPGTTHEYSSPNYQVLGALIEQVSGETFADYASRNIFQPLEMRHTFTAQDTAMRFGMSQGHRYWLGFPVPVTLPHEADRLSTAAVISSAEDLGHFLTAQLNGGRYGDRTVLSAAGMASMHEPGAVSEGFAYAMGWRVSRNAAGSVVIHHGGIVPHFRGKMVALPDLQWGVVVLTNSSTALPVYPASHRIADIIAAYLAGSPLPGVSSRTKIVFSIVAGVVVLLTLHQLRQILIAWRQPHRPTTTGRRRALARAALRLLLPVAILVGLPVLLRLPWSELLLFMPDIAYWVIVVAAVDITLILAQLFAALRQYTTDPMPR